jgi:folate-dependent phosphoribosylglycinamide formyltransferase PurN
MLNVHPALLPAFGGPGMYGMRVHEAVLAAGCRVSGATVHYVDERYDEGRIIAQWPVPVLPDDTAETLAARVLRVEHRLYPAVVDALVRANGRLNNDRPTNGRPAVAALADASFQLGDAAPAEQHMVAIARI